MDRRNINITGKSKGFTLIEMVFAIGVAVLALAAVALHIVNISDAYRSHETAVEVQQTAIKLEMAFTNNLTCTANFRGKKIMSEISGPIVLDIDGLYFADVSGQKSNDVLLAKNVPMQFVHVTQMELAPYEILGTDRLSANLTIRFSANNMKKGVQKFSRIIGLQLITKLGIIEECAGVVAQSDYTAKTCEIISNGLFTYNPATGGCRDRFDRMINTGDSQAASCPGDWVPAPGGVNLACQMIEPPEFNLIIFNDDYAKIEPSLYTGAGGAAVDHPVYSNPYKMRYNYDSATNKYYCGVIYSAELNDYINATGGNWADKFQVQINCITPFNPQNTSVATTGP